VDLLNAVVESPGSSSIILCWIFFGVLGLIRRDNSAFVAIFYTVLYLLISFLVGGNA